MSFLPSAFALALPKESKTPLAGAGKKPARLESALVRPLLTPLNYS